MNPLLHWLTSPEWTHVVGALLHSLWQGAVIALALAVLMRPLANPVARYRCALVTLGLVVMAGIVTWAVLNAPKSAVSVAITIPVTEPAIASVAAAVLNPNSTDKIVALGRMSPPPAPKYWIAWLAVVWMLGAIVMLLRAGIKVAGAENLRRSCQPLHDERMVALVAEARRAVGLVRKIRVAVTDKLTSPAVVGVLVPTLILPLSLFTALTPEQIRFILLHELAHIRRGDYFANLFQLFAEALLFFNPAVWWISHQIRREREACCDALAIRLSGAPADYARTLVRVAESILQPATTAALAFGNGQHEPSSLADRVQRLLVPGYRPALRLTWRAMLMALLVGGVLLFLSAVGARNVVGAVASNATETPSKPITNLRHVSGSETNSLSEIFGWKLDGESQSNQQWFYYRIGTNKAGPDESFPKVLDKGRQGILQRLDHIRLDNYFCDNLPLKEVLRRLSERARQLDPTKEGINFVIRPEPRVGTNVDGYAATIPISISTNYTLASLGNIIFFVVKNAANTIEYSIEDTQVEFYLKKSATNSMAGKNNSTTSNLRQVGDSVVTLFDGSSTAKIDPSLVAGMASWRVDGINTARSNIGSTTNSSNDVATNKNQTFTMPKWEGSWNPRFVKLRQAGATAMVWMPSDEEVLTRLEQIKFDSVFYQHRKLSEVLEELEKTLLATDPDKKGFRLALPPDWEYPAKWEGIESVVINMPSELRSTTMRSVLDAIVSGATRPIRYRLGGMCANFEMKFDAPTNMWFRRFDVYRKSFLPFIGVDDLMAKHEFQTGSNTNAPDKIGDAIRNRFLQAGVDLRPPNSALYKPGADLLYVHAPKKDIDVIEALLNSLSQTNTRNSLHSAATTNHSPQVGIAMTDGGKTNSMASSHLKIGGPRFTLFDENSTAIIDLNSAFGMDGWKVDSQSQFNNQWFWYRIGDTNTLTSKPLTTRTFSIDRNAFYTAVRQSAGLPETVSGTNLFAAVGTYFAKAGVNLDPAIGKYFFFRIGGGDLVVCAALPELDAFETFTRDIIRQPPQVNIKVKFVEIPQSLVSSILPGFFTNNIPASISRTQSLSGILTKKQMAEVHNRIVFRDGITLLSEGDVTTLSDQQCQIQTIEMRTIVTGINPQAFTPMGVASTSNLLETQLTPFGTTFNVIPNVSRDKANISLHVIPAFTEFLGYGRTSKVPVYVNGKKKKAVLPLPRHRIQQLTNDFVVANGQTLVLGNLPTTEVSKQPNGEFLTTDVTGSKTNVLFVLVTPTIIDPAGNRLNPDGKSPHSSPPNPK